MWVKEKDSLSWIGEKSLFGQQSETPFDCLVV